MRAINIYCEHEAHESERHLCYVGHDMCNFLRVSAEHLSSRAIHPQKPEKKKKKEKQLKQSKKE